MPGEDAREHHDDLHRMVASCSIIDELPNSRDCLLENGELAVTSLDLTHFQWLDHELRTLQIELEKFKDCDI